MTTHQVHGWCPGALRPMASGDGLVVRIRAPLGRLEPDQAAGLAALAERYGNGLIDLSARANLQLRGIGEADHAPLIQGLQRLGLVDPDLHRESRRNLIIAPFWNKRDETYRIAMSLTRALAKPGAPQLPGKFGFAVDCGPAPLLQSSAADIRIERSAAGLICCADGMQTGLSTDVESAAQAAMSLANWFLETGGSNNGRGRMARHIAHGSIPERHDIPRLPQRPLPSPGVMKEGALVALEFGQIRAQTLAQLAAAGPLRLTPWRMVLIERAPTLPDHPGLITDPRDPRLKISVCTGAPGCRQAHSETRNLARKLAPHIHTAVHVSGCTKGCAHPRPAALTLTATAPECFDVIHNGCASDTPTRTGLRPQDILNGEL